jgi:hypothetical protein
MVITFYFFAMKDSDVPYIRWTSSDGVTGGMYYFKEATGHWLINHAEHKVGTLLKDSSINPEYDCDWECAGSFVIKEEDYE